VILKKSELQFFKNFVGRFSIPEALVAASLFLAIKTSLSSVKRSLAKFS
jgi:UDP-N-acetylmuramyl pentapeptide synthase